ncbi:MAG: hypothetical protein K0U15_02240 [Proteobacteria bacterium]|nr:hypothetical protein [Pseudomonadota bacterium]
MNLMAKIVTYIFIPLALTSLFTLMSSAAALFIFGEKNYSFEEENYSFKEDIVFSIFWSFLCCYISWRMKLKYKYFFLCGFAWGELALSYLAIYPFIKAKYTRYNNYSDKEGAYNYYSFILGLIGMILVILSFFILFYFKNITE